MWYKFVARKSFHAEGNDIETFQGCSLSKKDQSKRRKNSVNNFPIEPHPFPHRSPWQKQFVNPI